MARKRVNDATFTDPYVDEAPTGKPLPWHLIMNERDKKAARADKLNKLAPLGFAPKGNESRPRKNS